MDKLRIPHGAFVLVCDGAKALLLHNSGDAELLDLKVEKVMEQENPKTSEQMSDHEGRVFHGSHRSPTDKTDIHDMNEERFARNVAAMLAERLSDPRFERLFVVAAPRTLAVLRKKMNPQVAGRILAEIDKDLVRRPVHEIERLLAGDGAGR